MTGVMCTFWRRESWLEGFEVLEIIKYQEIAGNLGPNDMKKVHAALAGIHYEFSVLAERLQRVRPSLIFSDHELEKILRISGLQY